MLVETCSKSSKNTPKNLDSVNNILEQLSH